MGQSREGRNGSLSYQERLGWQEDRQVKWLKDDFLNKNWQRRWNEEASAGGNEQQLVSPGRDSAETYAQVKLEERSVDNA